VKFELTILGSSSATPAHNRNQSCQLLNIDEQLFLLDCGEGAQLQFLKYKIKSGRIKHIFISHLHGDHYLGLFGFISSMHLQGRNTDLHIYGPPGLAEIITLQLKYSESVFNYMVHFHEISSDQPEVILDDEKVYVETMLMSHRIKCYGFIFHEKPKKRKLRKERLSEEIKLQEIIKLRNGEDLLNEDGSIRIKNEDVTFPPRPLSHFANCSDTIYLEHLAPQLQNMDLMYHEATFGDDMGERAEKTFHTTARQAATLALKANVKKLIIGHFSTRYRDLKPLLEQAREVFPNTYLAIEGENHNISGEKTNEIPTEESSLED